MGSVSFEEALDDSKQAVGHLRMRMASFEPKPSELVEDSKIYQQPMGEV